MDDTERIALQRIYIQRFLQLVIPTPFRNIVMKLAHESIMSGNLATKRSVDRVL